MAGNKNSGRPKISITEKKLRGTFRKDRHQDQEDVENILATTSASDFQVVSVPEALTDSYVIEAYKEHSKWLSEIKQIYSIDITELDQMYITLQQLRLATKKRIELETKGVIENLDEYYKLSQIEMKLRKQFIDMGKDFMMTPTVRSKLTIEQLTADKMLTDKKEKENLIEDLFK